MSKKQFLLMVLDKFQNEWLPASALRKLVEESYLDDTLIETIIYAFHKALNETQLNILKIRLQKGIDSLEHIKQLEKNTKLIE
jgi:hypothetical protein